VTAVENLLSQQAKEALHGGVVAGGPDSAHGANSRGGSRRGRIFSCNTAIVAPPYTASNFTQLCRKARGIRQSMGRVGSCPLTRPPRPSTFSGEASL
jgi:hypothetical protein